MKKIMLLLLIFTPALNAQFTLKKFEPERNVLEGVSEEQLKDEVILPRIDLKYRAGGYLIYDCSDQHFVCVDAKSFTQCQLEREISRERERLILACSPLKRYESFELCLNELYRLMHKASPKTICLNPKSI